MDNEHRNINTANVTDNEYRDINTAKVTDNEHRDINIAKVNGQWTQIYKHSLSEWKCI